MSSIDVITHSTYLLFVYLLFALFVERCLEVLVAVINYTDDKISAYRSWNRLANYYRNRLDKIYTKATSKSGSGEKILNQILWKTIKVEGANPTVSAAALRKVCLRIFVRFFGFIIALLLCFWMNAVFQKDLIGILISLLDDDIHPFFDDLILLKNRNLRILTSAAMISIGSEPLHGLIRRFESKIS